MTVKIAVASDDGKTINSHFGRANEFMIFRLTKDDYRYIETRVNAPACGAQNHNDDRLAASAALLSDCRGVIVSQIGPGAVDVLVERGILPFTMSGDIDEGLRVLVDSRRFRFRE